MGNQLLQTVASPLLVGASTASLSIWVRVNPGSVVGDPAGVPLFGDGGGKLAVGLTAAGQLRASWSANDGVVDHASGFSQALVPGVNYHLAVTWRDGAQQYFVNGLLVHSDSMAGTLGGLGDLASYPFRLGSGLAGVDVALDEPTLWVGYTLTSADVGQLRDRVVAPGAIAPASIALRWTLAGPDGGAAVPGGAGLIDASATGLNLTSVVGGAPSYQSGNLTYSLLDRGCSATVAPSGQAIFFTFHDAATNPSNVTNVVPDDEVQTVTLSGTPSGGAFTLGFGGQTTAPIPTTLGPPASFFQWNRPTLPAGTYDLAVNFYTGGYGSPNATYEILSGPGAILATVVVNQAGDNGEKGGPVNAAYFADASGLVQVGFPDGTGAGLPVRWHPLGRFTTTSAGLSVRLSCESVDAGQLFTADCLRIADTTGAVVARVQPTAPPATFVDSDGQGGFAVQYFQPQGDTSNGFFANGHGAGARPTVDPAALRSALEALSSIGTGNVAVAGNGTALTPAALTLQGALADVAQPLMVAGDPAVHVAEQARGGILPVLSRNGTPIPVARRQVYAYPDPIAPFVVVYFDQCPPATTYAAAGQYENALSANGGPSWQTTFDDTSLPTGYTGQTRHVAGNQATAQYQFRPVTPGTYRVSATWPAHAGYSSDVVYTVFDAVTAAVLGTFHTSQTAAPSGALDQGVPWQVLGSFTLTGPGVVNGLVVTQSNGTTLPMFADAVRFERTSADNSIRILPTDTLTYSAGAGWATCLAGPALAAPAGTPVANLSGGVYAAPGTGPVSMKLGFGIHEHTPAVGSYYYANIAHASDAFNAYPATIGGPVANIEVSYGSPVQGGDAKTWPNVPPGDYVLMWDGTGDARMNNTYNGATEQASQALFPAPGGVNNKRVYTLAANPFQYNASINLTLYGTTPTGLPDGSYHFDITNIRIYPAGTDLANPPKYTAEHLDRLAGTQVIRFNDVLRSGFSNSVTYADYTKDPASLSRNLPSRPVAIDMAANLVSITPYTGTEVTLDPHAGLILQYNFQPGFNHGLTLGQYFHLDQFNGPLATVVPDNPANVPAGDTPVTTFQVASLGQCVYPLADPTKFVAQVALIGRYPDPSRNVVGWSYRMTNTLTGVGGRIVLYAGCPIPLSEIVEQANACGNGAGADLYWNTSFTNNDDCLTRIATYLAQNLKPGRKLRVEVANEIWNSTTVPYVWATSANYALWHSSSTDYTVYYCETCRHHWQVMHDAWVAAGRASADFIRVLGSQMHNSGITKGLAEYCHSASPPIPFDEVTVANYLDIVPLDGSPGTVNDRLAFGLTPEQHLDHVEAVLRHGSYEGQIDGHRRALQQAWTDTGHTLASFVPAGVCCYEGGWDRLTVSCGREDLFPNFGRVSHATQRHPRVEALTNTYYEIFDRSGVTASMVYFLSGVDRASVEAWPVYTGTHELAYAPGNAGQDAIQAGQVDRMDLLQSTYGGGIKAFGARYNATPIPDFTLSVTGPATLTRGASVTLTVSLTALAGYAGTANLSVTGLPPGVTASAFSPPSLVGGGAVVSAVILTASPSAIVGPVTVTVTGTDAANSLAHSATTSLTVANAPDFSLSVSGSSGLVRGGTTTRTVTLTALSGYLGTATLSASGLPPGVVASFSPPALVGGGARTSTMTLTASGSATIGTFTVTVTGTDAANSLAHSATTSLTVAGAGPNFSLSVSGSANLRQNKTTTRTVTLTALSGYLGTATLSASGLPPGVVASFSPPALVGGGARTSTMTLTASGSATIGTFTVTVTGTDAANSLAHSATTSLTVVRRWFGYV